MTGLGSDSSKLYAIGASYYGYSVETYTWTGTVGSTPYVNTFTGLGIPYDCDISGGLIWTACDGADSPVKAFSTQGALVNMIPGEVVENAARGVAFESANIVWVSNPETDKIYRIDLSLGIGGEEGGMEPVTLGASANPFSATVEIEGSGFGDGATLEIFDMSGRMIERAAFDGAFFWNGSNAPSGAYIVRVADGESLESLRLVKF